MRVNCSINSVVTPDSLAAKAALKVRLKIYRMLSEAIDLENLESVLDVGATADTDAAYSNFFENLYPHPERITALSDQDVSGIQQMFPKIKFVQGDGCKLPFEDGSFELVFSSAVLEHVGNRQRQLDFVREAVRVSSRYVFLTTPNRFHPLEFHTKLPFLHWLPKKIHRWILRRMKLDFLSREEHLNLLSQSDLKSICDELDLEYKLTFTRFLGCRANQLLLIETSSR